VLISSSSKGNQKPVVKEEPGMEVMGGLRDNDEIEGAQAERDAAVKSPAKGKIRLTSAACFDTSVSINIFLIQYFRLGYCQG
jgi:hypothetical protein